MVSTYPSFALINPALVIILGTPSSGKTTLARHLAADLALPCLGKDEIKEALFDCVGLGDRAWSRRLSDASFAVMMRLAQVQLSARVSVLVEGNWRPAHAAPWLGILAETGARAAQICCFADPGEIARRFAARSRHAGHLDAELAVEQAGSGVQAPAFLAVPGERIVYRSDGADDFGRVRDAIRSWLAPAGGGRL
jgi:predicted kinase